jgi:hypothetical protein
VEVKAAGTVQVISTRFKAAQFKMAAERKKDEATFQSVKYYQLNDENVDTYYDDWRYKTLLLIRAKGWTDIFSDPDRPLPTQEEAESLAASKEDKRFFKENEEAREDELRSWRSRQQERYELFQHHSTIYNR